MAEQIEFDQAHQALQEVTEALENGRFVHVRRQLQDMEPEDIAHLLEASPRKSREVLWQLTDPEDYGEILDELNEDVKDSLVSKMAPEALAEATWEVKSAKNYVPTPLQTETEAVQIRQPQPQRAQADEKTLRWQAKNQWFGAQGFEEVTSYALGLHQKLVSNGVDPRSDSYFEQIDARVKSKFPEVFGSEDEKPRSNGTQGRKPASVVAPASRSTGKRKIELTPSQAALVKKFNLDPQKYAQEVLKLETQNG